ncbi:alpha/beta-Hydrolases superfamily protein [Striga asiatica]|uniref:Alpha/beta-Hydrolases superfamily protein n=1 Tax=Striga asiatica TaxID=4170 RepID=A0A5A7PU75_STRAF|nr:alpha/beta-Hydrolases superfamily protein [Striga asiatica]
MASTRILQCSSRHLCHSITPGFRIPSRKNPHFHFACRFSSLSFNSQNHSSKFQFNRSFNSRPVPGTTNLSIPGNFAHQFLFGPYDASFRWNFASGPNTNGLGDGIAVHDGGPEIAVVILGWLGAKPKHLRRYVELYNAKGIHAVTFVASVMDVLSFDLGKKLEARVKQLADELVSWLSSESGRDRCLIFHTFSNTGWLAYGAILDTLKNRQDLLEKIKGCVVDSGGDPNIDPKVWAAGFTTALLKKSSSATYISTEPGQGNHLRHATNASKILEKEPFLIESLMLFAFEKLFSYLLNLPDINQRLTKIISGLLKNQPMSPQLYLYSTGDKVIPFKAVESFIEEQKRSGKQVSSFNFGSSPHVDHYRTFPDLYAAQLDSFLKECLVMEGKL